MQLMLNDEEKQALLEVLEDALPNLREEIYKTENYGYREELKRREMALKVLLTRLGNPS